FLVYFSRWLLCARFTVRANHSLLLIGLWWATGAAGAAWAGSLTFAAWWAAGASGLLAGAGAASTCSGATGATGATGGQGGGGGGASGPRGPSVTWITIGTPRGTFTFTRPCCTSQTVFGTIRHTSSGTILHATAGTLHTLYSTHWRQVCTLSSRTCSSGTSRQVTHLWYTSFCSGTA